MITLREIWKTYHTGDHPVPALHGVSLSIQSGEFVAITGPSGSGKSTLMNIIGLLEGFDSGRYLLAGVDVGGLTDDEAAALRNRHIGFVFQSFNLIPRLTAIRNVELPLMYAGMSLGQRRELAAEALARVGLGHRIDHTPAQLSGGQQQRVAIARALVNSPNIIIADEPTGALDSATSEEVMSIFHQLHQAGATILVVTHDDEVAAHARRVLHMRDGEIRFDRSR